ncbi:MAG: acyl carrier protein [Ilumatobacteraceae bacterium]|nr:acyl carrier protein [Ilumatobacteraceae bacterium]
MSERTETIRNILSKHGKLNGSADSIDEDKSLYSAGLTSHASVNVMLALEDEFDIEFPERMLTRSTFETVANLKSALDSLLGEETSV